LLHLFIYLFLSELVKFASLFLQVLESLGLGLPLFIVLLLFLAFLLLEELQFFS
jgi:hypothetical protein